MAKDLSASTRAKNKYRDKAYDQINVVVPKGKKADLQAHVADRGESLNGFVNRAIDNQIEIDNTGGCSNAGGQGDQRYGFIERIGAVSPRAKELILQGKTGLNMEYIASIDERENADIARLVNTILKEYDEEGQ